MLSKTSEKLFMDFYNDARFKGVLDKKTAFLVHAAAAMAVGCEP